MLPGGSTYNYTYDNYHNPLTATSATGIRSTLTYAGNGNLMTMVTGTSTPKIEVHAQYTSDGNYISSMTDSLRKVTQYGYDTQKGQLNWIQQSGDTTQTRTNYTYDTLGRLTGLSRAISATGNSAALQYAYEEDLLKTITTNSTTYTNTYGDFGLKQSVKAGEHTLASYTYDVAGKSFLLTRLSYGNGSSVADE